ncbi:uncharacterized protein VTP21DRAFT_11251 [Calcarisporiella thermophila]|uniref:uncharacterized protein n=1 Tax=Calcarisporiella thermophila TaxID=911321 RepID=UPI0037424620
MNEKEVISSHFSPPPPPLDPDLDIDLDSNKDLLRESRDDHVIDNESDRRSPNLPRRRSSRSLSPDSRWRHRSRSRSRSRPRSHSRSPSRARSKSRSRSHDRGRRHDRYSPSSSSRSSQNCRVYVGNLAYGVNWRDLKDFMREAGEVTFANVLTLPNGASKGCGIVEYKTPEDAQRAIRRLNDTRLMGRPIFVREDREETPRFGRTSFGQAPAPPTNVPPGCQIFVGNLPYSTSWQDLKDYFRSAGRIVRADILLEHTGRSKGAGTVLFESVRDANNAIAMFNGRDYKGRKLEVREDRFAGHPPPRHAGRFGHDYRPRVPYGNEQNGAMMDAGNGYTAGGGAFSYPTGPAGAEPSRLQIYVQNLPYNTTDQDLRDLFRGFGEVVFAQVLMQGGRPKGSGVVRFDSTSAAERAVATLQGYTYGGRQLELHFDRYG